MQDLLLAKLRLVYQHIIVATYANEMADLFSDVALTEASNELQCPKMSPPNCRPDKLSFDTLPVREVPGSYLGLKTVAPAYSKNQRPD